MKFSDKRFSQIWNEQIKRNGEMSSAEAMHVAIELFRKESSSDDLEDFKRWLATDPAPSVDDLSEEDRMGFAAMSANEPQGCGYANKAYFTDRNKWAPTRHQYNATAKAVIDAYTND